MANENILVRKLQVFDVIDSGIRMMEGGPEQCLLVRATEESFDSKKQAEEWIQERGRIMKSYTIIEILERPWTGNTAN